MENIERIKSIIQSSIDVKESILQEDSLIQALSDTADFITQTFQKKNKVLLCGNGGSAADAQHLAAEFTGRFYKDREPLFAEALHVNTSYLTAVANDYSFDEVYSRLIKAKGNAGDVLIAISTSGNSSNIIKAAQQAQAQQLKVIGFTGASGGLLKDSCDWLINVPSTDTPRIQEAHILVGHILCELVERSIF